MKLTQPLFPALSAAQKIISYQPDGFEIVQLGKNTFPEVVKILEAVREALPEDEKHFIKPQSLKDLYNHNARGFPVIGSIEKSTGKIAALLLITPSEGSDANPKLANYPSRVKECDTGIISSVATTPGYKGQMPVLLAAAEAFAAKRLVAVWAKVSVANEKSNQRFKDAGFDGQHDPSRDYDPDKGYPVTYYRKSLVGIAPRELPLFNEGNEQPVSFAYHNDNGLDVPSP